MTHFFAPERPFSGLTLGREECTSPTYHVSVNDLEKLVSQLFSPLFDIIHIFNNIMENKNTLNSFQIIDIETIYSRTLIKETRIKETFGYKKRFHSSDFMQVKLSTLIEQLIKETMDKRNPFLTAQ